MSPSLRFPPLFAQFTVLGAAAGWLWCEALGSPATQPRSAIAGAIAGAVTGVIAGVVLTPSRPQEEWMPRRPSTGLTTVVVLAAGFVAGLLLGPIHGSSVLAPLAGLLFALPLVPVAAILIAAVQRADRARPGSIVARADQRAVISLLAAALGGLSAIAVPGWIAATSGLAEPPYPALLLVAASGALVLGVLLFDWIERIRVDRLAARIAGGDLAPGSRRVDLGLGDEVASSHAETTAYRGGARTVNVALGNPEDARAALSRSILRGAAALALIEIVALGHGLARDPEAAAMVAAHRCEGGEPSACRAAAQMAERAGEPTEDAARLHRLACASGDGASCTSVGLLYRRDHPLF
jgi:hypothetical protein